MNRLLLEKMCAALLGELFAKWFLMESDETRESFYMMINNFINQ
jgi:hypothetical protein